MSTRAAGGAPPGAGGVRTVDELAARLRALHSWAGVSYREIHRRVVALRRRRGVAELPVYNTVYRCLQPHRARLDVELVVDIVTVLLDDEALVAEWRQAHQVVVGRAADAAIVTVHDGIRPESGPFAGRTRELARLRAAVDAGNRTLVIDGMPGIGKTRLAHRLAHELLRDGLGSEVTLSVDLRGFDPERPPADPAAVLDGILRRLGVPGSHVHGLDLAGRMRAYRERMAGRSAVVLLDDAATDDQVAPLLADGPDVVTIVTSRRSLDRLPGAERLTLDVLEPHESLALLGAAIGDPPPSGGTAAGVAAVGTAEHGRAAAGVIAAADVEAAAGLARLAGHLPLALAVLATRIADSPGWTLADHLERLTEHQERLRLDDGVGPALALSYEALPDDHRRLLRLLTLHPGRDVDEHAVVAITGLPHDVALRFLDDLVGANLVQRRAPGRHSLHDLVRVFAADRSRDEDSATVRRAAVGRLFDHYRWAAARAAARYVPYELTRAPVLADPGTGMPEPPTREAAKEWLDAERVNLLAIARAAAQHGSSEHVTDLSTLLHYYLDKTGRFPEAEALHESAVAHAVDDHARSRAHNDLGCVYWRLGRYAEGRDQYQHALDLTRRLGDRAWTARCLANVALGHFRLGRYADAIECQRQALEIFADVRELPIASTTHGGLGWGLLRLGRLDEALHHFERGLAIARRAGEATFEEAYALVNVAFAHERLGSFDTATEHAEHALELSRRLGFRSGEGDALNVLGRIHLGLGDADRAVALHTRAVATTAEIGNRALTVEIRNDLGAALCRAGRSAEAGEQHALALTDAEATGDTYELARAHHGLADATGDETHRRQARALFTALGVVEAAALHTAGR